MEKFISNLNIKINLIEPEDLALKNFKDKHEQNINLKWEVQIETELKVYQEKEDEFSNSISFNANDYSLISDDQLYNRYNDILRDKTDRVSQDKDAMETWY
jgi:squalene cyclase